VRRINTFYQFNSFNVDKKSATFYSIGPIAATVVEPAAIWVLPASRI